MENYPNKSDKKIKLIFAGTSDFGVPALEALNKAPEFKILEVISQPDKKSGRNLSARPTPIKKTALDLRLTVKQPDNIKSLRSHIQELEPDLIVVAAYAQLIPDEIIAIPGFGCINIHASLLPKYRGSACVQAAILNGDKESGITIMKMDENLDTGEMLKQFSLPVSASDTAGALFGRLAALAGQIICPVIIDYAEGRIKPAKQPASAASYVKKLRKQDGRIDWSKPADYNERFIRAMQPWPGAYSRIEDKLLKIKKTSKTPLESEACRPGELFIVKDRLAIQCGDKALEVKKLQLEGKKEISAADFVRGYPKFIGQVLR